MLKIQQSPWETHHKTDICALISKTLSEQGHHRPLGKQRLPTEQFQTFNRTNLKQNVAAGQVPTRKKNKKKKQQHFEMRRPLTQLA